MSGADSAVPAVIPWDGPMLVDAPHAGRLLVEMRETGRHLPELPDGLRPGTWSEAYAIQDALQEAGGWAIGALKVGCTSAAAQAALRIGEPIGGRLPTDSLFASGVELPVGRFHHVPLLECEFGLRIGVDVPAGTPPPTDADDCWTLVDAVVPAIELVDSRFRQQLGASGPSLVADNAVAAAVVLGTPVPVDRPVDLASATVTLSAGGRDTTGAGPVVDAAADEDEQLAEGERLAEGEQLAEGSGAAVLGDPIRSLQWALAHEHRRGRSIAAGTVVITGTCTGLVPPPVDVAITADFGPWGIVSFTLLS